MNAGDKVVITGAVDHVSLDMMKQNGIEIGSVHTLINDHDALSQSDIRNGWLGIEFKGSLFTHKHFKLDVLTPEPKITKEAKMHIEAMPRQYKIILDTESIGLLIAALSFAGAPTNKEWKEETRKKVLEFHNKLHNAKHHSVCVEMDYSPLERFK